MELFYAIYIHNGKIAFLKSKGPMYKSLLVLPECDPIEENFIGSFKHSYTKYRLKVNLYRVEELPPFEYIYLTLEEAFNAHISSLTKKALTLVAK
jgi:A/G-specific adenine glycosylase